MKRMLILLAFCSVALAASTGRDYYGELYKAGGLDHNAASYVCFPDEENGLFTIFSKSDAGKYDKLPKAERDALDGGFIYVRTYRRGIADEAAQYDKDGDSYLLEGNYKADKSVILKMRYTFNWSTLRYRYSVETYRHGKMFGAPANNYGKCELIPSEVKQTGQ